MIAQICKEINNWFEKCICTGRFTITDGVIDLTDLAEDGDLQSGQYFRVAGSVFNDGVYEYPAAEMVDETFVGAIWCMAPPKDFLDLVDDISAWNVKYADAIESPYQSESFGGYSYSKSNSGSDGNSGASWKSQFKSRLNRWRKI